MHRPHLSRTPLSIAIQRQTVCRTLLSGAFAVSVSLGATTAYGQVTEGTGSYTSDLTSSAVKLPLSSRETPQTVTVITRQQMDDQGDWSIGDVLRNAPGISTQAYDTDRLEYLTRGSTIRNFQFDGVNSLYDEVFDEGAAQVDMAIYDRVDIVKGSTGMFSGSGDPSATVNLIRKKPTREFKASISGSAGSWDTYRTEADISGPLTDDGGVRGRFVAAYQDGNSYRDHYSKNNDVFYGVLEADLNPDTLLTFGMDYQDIKPKGASWGGNPVFFSDGSRTDFSRSFNPATDWSRRHIQARSTFAALEHRLANDWKINASLTQQVNDHNSKLGSASGGNPDPVTGDGVFLNAGKWEGHRVQDTADINATGPFTLFGRVHELVVGATSQSARQTGATFANPPPLVVPGSIFDWSGEFPEPAFAKNGKYEKNTRQNSAYITARFKPTDYLAVILGSRLSDFQYNETYNYYAKSPIYQDSHTSAKHNGQLTPYAGLVLDLDPVYSLYASYTSIYQPQAEKDASGKTLSPLEGKSYEIGMKAAYLEGRLNASMALFHTDRDHVAENIGYNARTNEGYYRAINDVTTKGVELQLSGALTPDWNLMAGYTLSQTRGKGNHRVYGSPLATTAPENLVHVFTTYRLPGVMNKVTVGGGVDWQSEFYGRVYYGAPGNNQVIQQDSYALVNLMTRYDYNEHLAFTVNANNVFDKSYISGLDNFSTTYYGEPRNVMLTTKYSF